MAVFGVLALVSLASRRGLAQLSDQAGRPLTPVKSVTGRSVGAALLSLLAIALAVGLRIQLTPVPHTNPPVQTPLQWDSPQTQQLATAACMNCHSNQTRWPWYTYVAPASWLIVSHVNSGRDEVSFSDLNSMPTFQKSSLPNKLADDIRTGQMPPTDYMLIHPDTQLTASQREQLIQGLQATLAKTLATTNQLTSTAGPVARQPQLKKTPAC